VSIVSTSEDGSRRVSAYALRHGGLFEPFFIVARNSAPRPCFGVCLHIYPEPTLPALLNAAVLSNDDSISLGGGGMLSEKRFL
jgi:hypothetical protein